MDHVKNMSRSSHLIGWGGLLLFIFLFFDWQQVCVSFGGHSACGGRSGWAGWGVLIGILTIALVAWEAVQIFGVKINLPFEGKLATVIVAGAILLFTVIKVLTINYRHWPAWIGLILAIVIAGGAYLRWSGDEPVVIETSKAPPAAPPPAPPAEPPAA